MQPIRIVFYGNFGAGNLGNESTLQTAIEQTLARLPSAKLMCVCPNPEDVRARHGIAGTASLSHGYAWSWSDLDAKQSNDDLEDMRTRDRRTAGSRGPLRKWGSKLARLGRIAFLRAPQELIHWYKMLRLLAGSDVLLVPGTGIVTDGACGSLGWPYDMFKLTLLARLCRARVVFLSVGAGPFRHRLGCWFIRRSLAWAHYRSYRDVDSKRRLEHIGLNISNDAVYPDLVFGLSRAELTPQRTHAQALRVVGLGLKDYAVPTSDADAQGYRDYLVAMAEFVTWLQMQGYTVRLIIGDAQYDTRVRQDLIALLKARNAKGNLPLSDPVPTVRELLRQLGEAEAVVSPRFHNLVLALMLNKPVLALSDLPKVDALLNDFGLERFCLPLKGLKAEDLTDRFVQLQNAADHLKPFIHDGVEKYRRAVEEQYDKVYGSNPDTLAAVLREGGTER